MGIKYKPGQLNTTFTDPASMTAPVTGTGRGFAPGGVDQAQTQSDITLWGQSLAERVKMGDPEALMELQTLVRADKKKVGDDRANLARKISNTYTGTKYLTPYDDSSVLGDMAPGLALMGGIAGLGLIAPALAGGGAAASAGGFGTAGMAGATGAGGLGAAGAGLGVGAGAAGSAGSGGGLGGLGAGAAGSAGTAGAAGGLGGASGLLGSLGGLKNVLPLAGGIMGTIGAGKLGGQAEDLRNQAARIAMQDYEGRKPFREAALSGLMGPQPQREDLSGMYDPMNPYKRPVPRPGA